LSEPELLAGRNWQELAGIGKPPAARCIARPGQDGPEKGESSKAIAGIIFEGLKASRFGVAPSPRSRFTD
jgi:hypothetical protein